MFDKYIRYQCGLHKSNKLNDEIKSLIKKEYMNSKLKFNEQIAVKGWSGKMVIDAGRPHERFLVEFCNKYKDLLKDINLSLNDVQPIIDEVEEEYMIAEAKIQKIIGKQKIKNRKTLEAKISSKEKEFLDEIYSRRGDILKIEEDLAEDELIDKSKGIKQ